MTRVMNRVNERRKRYQGYCGRRVTVFGIYKKYEDQSWFFEKINKNQETLN